MRAMILAAGRGERMRPLTDHTPKPLLQAAGKPLIIYHIEALVGAGITEIVVNSAWLGDQIVQTLGDGAAWGANIQHSREQTALETAGGIARALPLLGSSPFLLMNGDVFTDWNPEQAIAAARQMRARDADMWLLMVDNPAHHQHGDFALDETGRLSDGGTGALTYSGIGVYDPRCFAGLDPDRAQALPPLMRQCMHARRVLGTHYRGRWDDIGTPERLAALNASLHPGADTQ